VRPNFFCQRPNFLDDLAENISHELATGAPTEERCETTAEGDVSTEVNVFASKENNVASEENNAALKKKDAAL
jgi:hypothetical protein